MKKIVFALMVVCLSSEVFASLPAQHDSVHVFQSNRFSVPGVVNGFIRFEFFESYPQVIKMQFSKAVSDPNVYGNSRAQEVCSIRGEGLVGQVKVSVINGDSTVVAEELWPLKVDYQHAMPWEGQERCDGERNYFGLPGYDFLLRPYRSLKLGEFKNNIYSLVGSSGIAIDFKFNRYFGFAGQLQSHFHNDIDSIVVYDFHLNKNDLPKVIIWNKNNNRPGMFAEVSFN